MQSPWTSSSCLAWRSCISADDEVYLCAHVTDIAAEPWPELLLLKLLSSTFALKNALYMPRNAIESLY